jgi:DNA-binding NarL/FixJ family response regulator
VLDLLLASPLHSNQALADTLGCTVKNVEFHMSNILRKTNTAQEDGADREDARREATRGRRR